MLDTADAIQSGRKNGSLLADRPILGASQTAEDGTTGEVVPTLACDSRQEKSDLPLQRAHARLRSFLHTSADISAHVAAAPGCFHRLCGDATENNSPFPQALFRRASLLSHILSVAICRRTASQYIQAGSVPMIPR